MYFSVVFSPLSLFFFCLFLHADWEEEQVSSPNILRLIYQGRFLHGNVTLGGEKAPPARRLFPEPPDRGGSVLRTSLL